jgi:hypothetical protein
MPEAILIIAALALIIYCFRKYSTKQSGVRRGKFTSIDDRFNAERRARELEIDRLLNKMGKNGAADLSKKDRQRLEELSKK